MAYNLFEYVDSGGEAVFSAWRNGLELRQRAGLDSKINMLRTAGADLPAGLLAGVKGYGHIRKLKVKGNVQLRPRLCPGPINHQTEFSLLVGAVEVGFATRPSNANALADARRTEIISDPNRRRRAYGS